MEYNKHYHMKMLMILISPILEIGGAIDSY